MTPLSRHPSRTAHAALAALIAVLTLPWLSACADTTPRGDNSTALRAWITPSFQARGQAGLERLSQDALQEACSAPVAPPDATLQALAAEQAATVRPPSDGRYLGDWRAGEALAQNGRGMTWSDAAGSANGGNCYNCHELSRTEIAFGTLGPSLYQYGRRHQVSDPASPAAATVLAYTWAKLYNAKATNPCSIMPRFGHAGVLTESQLRDLMALLLDPASPVNR